MWGEDAIEYQNYPGKKYSTCINQWRYYNGNSLTGVNFKYLLYIVNILLGFPLFELLLQFTWEGMRINLSLFHRHKMPLSVGSSDGPFSSVYLCSMIFESELLTVLSFNIVRPSPGKLCCLACDIWHRALSYTLSSTFVIIRSLSHWIFLARTMSSSILTKFLNYHFLCFRKTFNSYLQISVHSPCFVGC